MSEKISTQKEEIRKAVIAAAQDPAFYLKKNFNKGAVEAIIFLMQVRNNIKQDSTYKIEEPDVDFKTFFHSGNGEVQYYEAMIRMLQKAGYQRNEIASSFMEVLPVVDKNTDRASVIKQYLGLTEEALELVFGSE